MRDRLLLWAALAATALLLPTLPAAAADCPVTHDKLVQALKASVQTGGGPRNGGLETNEWAAVVDREGMVCAIAFSGSKPDDQWPGSRGIAPEKANPAKALSLKQMALSTANLYAGGQPGGPLYGLANSNPPATDVL